jgi:N-acetylglucosamine kinase-like BadF-type ATPase
VSPNRAEGLLLGLDIGGSGTRARLVEGGRIIAEVEGRGANPAAVAAAVVERRLEEVLHKLGPVKPAACCAGAAGAEVPAARARLEALLVRLLPGTRVEVVHDARLVLAAAGLEHGVVLIAGTGSVAYGRDSAGREARAGGWGWLLGDDGSGAWIVREGAREIARRADAGEPPGPLGDCLLSAAGAAGAVELTGRLHRLREPRRWAALSGSVFAAAQTDPAAAALVSRAGAALAALVAAVRGRIDSEDEVVLAGGLLLHQPLLEAAVRERLEGRLIRLREPPVAGAVRLAAELANEA